MLFGKNLTSNSITSLTHLKRVAASSGASRKKKVVSVNNFLSFKTKKLNATFKWSAGRSNSKRITVRTKGKILRKYSIPVVNTKFRDNSISIISGFRFNYKNSSLFSLVTCSSGSQTYVRSPGSHGLFFLTRLMSLFSNKSVIYKSITSMSSYLTITPLFFLIVQLPKNSPISMLELSPNKGVKYALAAGSSGVILKLDTRLGSAIIKLPSNVKKVFSIFSTGSAGCAAIEVKSRSRITSAGHYKSLGHKSISRGVARNPVDHPHGGRAKSIKYPRTPWGKTTKFK